MISCGKFLVVPNLGPGDPKLTALSLHKVMKGSKTIYMSPGTDIQIKEVKSTCIHRDLLVSA